MLLSMHLEIYRHQLQSRFHVSSKLNRNILQMIFILNFWAKRPIEPGHFFPFKEPTLIECQIDSGKGDGSTTSKKLPMLCPHEILQYLMDIGLYIDMDLVKSYWTHLESVNNSWAKRVNDHALIPYPAFDFFYRTPSV